MKNQPIKNNDLKERKVVSKSKKKKLVLRKEFIVLFLILFTILGLYSSYNIIRWAIDAENTEKQIEEIHETVEIKEITVSEYDNLEGLMCQNIKNMS